MSTKKLLSSGKFQDGDGCTEVVTFHVSARPECTDTQQQKSPSGVFKNPGCHHVGNTCWSGDRDNNYLVMF